jgi:formylglycine-generating enzyme required for sulfatase activity
MPQLPYLRLCLLVLCSVTVCVALWRLLPAPVIAQADIIRPKPKPTPRPTPRPAPRPTTPRREARPGQTPAPVNVNIEMVELPGGTFTMGSNDFFAEEKPPHQVTVSPFSIGRYEITQAQYRAVMGTNPSYYEGDDRPVERVSWNDAVEFCRKLSQTSGRAYRLPTEAEWEYACRAGSNTKDLFKNKLSVSDFRKHAENIRKTDALPDKTDNLFLNKSYDAGE